MTVTTLTKPKRERNEQYLAWIRTVPCILLGKMLCQQGCSNGHLCYGVIEPNHIRPIGHGGIGTKPSDRRTLPFCTGLHREYHDIGREEFERRWNIDLEAEIVRLNRIYRPPKVRKQRELKPTVRIKIDHCCCGRSHLLPLAKLDRIGSIEFTCPLAVEKKR